MHAERIARAESGGPVIHGYRPPLYAPEDDEGDTEYKWRLLPSTVTPDRFVHLVTQMKFRLREGRGRCWYRIGVSDSGDPKGLSPPEYEATLQMIREMASAAGAVVEELHRFEFAEEEERWCGELQVIRDSAAMRHAEEEVRDRDSKPEEEAHTRVAFCGPFHCGKTTLMSVLLSSDIPPELELLDGGPLSTSPSLASWALDNGHGSARHRLLSHRHELETGRTTRATARSWRPHPPGSSSAPQGNVPLVLVDIGDGLTKSVLFALLHHAPHLICLCVAADTLGDTASSGVVPSIMGDSPPLRAFLDLMWELQAPVLLVVTKKDLVEDELEWDQVLLEFIETVEGYSEGRWTAVEQLSFDDAEPSNEVLHRMMRCQTIPVMEVSCVTGEGLDHLIHLLGDAVPALPHYRSPLNPPTPLFDSTTLGTPERLYPALSPLTPPPQALDSAEPEPSSGYFELMIDDLTLETVENDTVTRDIVGVRGRIACGSIHVGQSCVLGPLGDGRFVQVGVVVECVAHENHEVCLRASQLGSGEPAWVLVEPPHNADREVLLEFLERFKRNRRHPKGRVLLRHPPSCGPSKRSAWTATPFTAITWNCSLQVVQNLSCSALLPSCQPLLIARHTVQAVSLCRPSRVTDSLQLHSPLLEPKERRTVALWARFLFTPEVLWLGELVLLQWPPGGLAVARVSALSTDSD